MHQSAFRVEEGRIRDPSKGPIVPYFSGVRIKFDKQSAVARHEQKIRTMVDIHPVSAA